MTPETLARLCYGEDKEFIAKVIQGAIHDERERCAKIAEEIAEEYAAIKGWGDEIAAAIRAQASDPIRKGDVE
jgi:hypothetical protein